MQLAKREVARQEDAYSHHVNRPNVTASNSATHCGYISNAVMMLATLLCDLQVDRNCTILCVIFRCQQSLHAVDLCAAQCDLVKLP